MTTAVVFHGNELSEERLREALPAGTSIVVVRLEGGTEAYQTLAERRFPTLADFMTAHAPFWGPGEPLILLSFSAGTWALRHYMRDLAARSVTRAVVVMDGLYGGVPCNLGPFDGIVAYAQEANAAPNQKRLVLTYSLATPAPAACTQAVEEIAAGPGLVVAQTHTTTHEDQLIDVGPDAVAEFITPWLTAPRKKRRNKLLVIGAAVVALGYGVIRFFRRG